jgi:quercetin 2,3-dioxygenase
MQSANEVKPVKKLRCIQRSVDRHWVGDGFPVRTLFSYPNLGSVLSPFLLLDYAGPMEFPPTDKRLGVGEHPHRGFETVTIVYGGEVEHRDSSGGGGSIGPGDVQWMTAGSGLVHEEFHGRGFARRGGMFEMVQLWVNLPAKYKMVAPRYQGILNSQKQPDSQRASARRPGNCACHCRRIRWSEGASQDLHAYLRMGSALDE